MDVLKTKIKLCGVMCRVWSISCLIGNIHITTCHLYRLAQCLLTSWNKTKLSKAVKMSIFMCFGIPNSYY